MVMRMNADKTSGVAVQDVDAPVDYVLAQITNGEAYVGKVPNLGSVKNYYEKKRSDGAVETKATYIVKLVMGYQLEYYISQIYIPKNRCLTWTLDYTRKSDLHDSVGYWRVDPIPNRADRSRVFYSSASLVLGLPQFIMDLLTSQALKASTAWVKKHAELEYEPKRAAAQAAADAAARDKGAATKGAHAGGAGKQGRLSWRCAFALSNRDITAPEFVAQCLAEAGQAAPAPSGDSAAPSDLPSVASRLSLPHLSPDGTSGWFNLVLIGSMLLLHCSSPYRMFLVVAC